MKVVLSLILFFVSISNGWSSEGVPNKRAFFQTDGFIPENLSFAFRSKKLPVSGAVAIDEMIDIEPFDAPGVGMVDLPQFRLIFGYGSLSIFDALGVDEVAGLKRADAIQKISDLKAHGKTEADGAFIAGLTNLHGRQMFMFFNLDRLNSSVGYANRVLAHEPLHLARCLITTVKNPMVDYINDPYVKLDDDNEEYFAEVLERAAAIAINRYQKIQPDSK
jgi:hypothetical protein